MRRLTKNEAQHQKNHQYGALSPLGVHASKPNAPAGALQLCSAQEGMHDAQPIP